MGPLLASDRFIELRQHPGEGVGPGGSPSANVSLPADRAQDPLARAHFLSRCRVWQRISHPAVVPLDLSQTSEGEVLVRIEPGRGRPLSQLLDATRERGETVPQAAVIHITSGILDALNGAWNSVSLGAPQHLFHGQITPAQVLVYPNGQVCLLGFGEQAQAENPSSVADITAVFEVFPTATSPRLDLYALLALMYELVSLEELPNPGDYSEGSGSGLLFVTVPGRLERFCPGLGEIAQLCLHNASQDHGSNLTTLARQLLNLATTRNLGGKELLAWIMAGPANATQTLSDVDELELLTPVPASSGVAKDSSPGDNTFQLPALRSRIVGRYELLNFLGRGGMGAVFRALDRLTGRVVTVKFMFSPEGGHATDRSAQSRMTALVREFRTLATLRHPHIISVLDFGFTEDGSPFFTMDLQENAQDILTAALSQPMSVRFELLAQFLSALCYLHRRGVLHCDLKPGNVLAVHNHVKVLDFGVSVPRARVEEGSVGGTLGYAAPEVMRGQYPTEVSDLFSFGIIAAQVLGGNHPYRQGPGSSVMQNILHQEPVLGELDVDEGIVGWLSSLVARDPAQRPPSAEVALATLAKLTRMPLDQESAQTRESYLQSARMVGRDTELESLKSALTRARAGEGALWLVGGESGVGKSRVMDELLIHGMSSGMLVVRGQARSEVRQPWQLWRDVLLPLILRLKVTDVEAAGLVRVVPELETLLERTIEAPSEMTGTEAIFASHRALESMLPRVGRGVLIILEDLQWAGSESLALLGRLALTLGKLPVVIVGTWRSDEAPELPSQFVVRQTIRLGRLSDGAVDQLLQAMLGRHRVDPEVEALVLKESEGNPFFVVEVIRSLAEEAGGLAQVDRDHLPQRLVAGSVKRYLKRRLDRLPRHHRPVLELAAVAGRWLDVDLLTRAVATVDVPTWLHAGERAGVLEVRDGLWCFAHDKLREFVLSELAVEATRTYHHTLAQAGEKRVELGQQSPMAAASTLAYHFKGAGIAEREAFWVGIAGKSAMIGNAFMEAQSHLQRRLELAPISPLSQKDEVQILTQLGEAADYVGRPEDGVKLWSQGLEVLARPLPRSTAGWVWAITSEIVRQIWHRKIAMPLPSLTRDPNWIPLSELYLRLLRQAYRTGKVPIILYGTFAYANLGDHLKSTVHEALAQASVCLTLSGVGLSDLATPYGERGIEMARVVGDDLALALALQMRSFHTLSEADYATCRRDLEEARGLAQRCGAGRVVAEMTAVLVGLYNLEGRAEEGHRQWVPELQRLARSVGGPLPELWGYLLRTEGLLRVAGQRVYPQVVADLTAAVPLLETAEGLVELLRYQGVRAGLALRTETEAEALARADEAQATLVKSPPTGPMWLYESIGNMVGVYLELWERANFRGEVASTTLQESTRTTLKLLGIRARSYRVARSVAWLLEARYLALLGKRQRALALLEKARLLAEQIGGPWEIGVIHHQFGRLLFREDQARALGHLDQAEQAFKMAHSEWWVQRTQSTRDPAAYSAGRLPSTFGTD